MRFEPALASTRRRSVNRGAALLVALLVGCSSGDQEGGRIDPGGPAAAKPAAGGARETGTDDQATLGVDRYRPPLYWSVYEYNFLRQQAAGGGDPNNLPGRAGENFIPENELLANIEWVERELKPFGYDMIAIDGWGDATRLSEHGYRASHSRFWQRDFAWWSAYLRERGLRLGMYENPLTVHVPRWDQTTKIVGTDIPVSSLVDYDVGSRFRWVDVRRPGAEQYVKGYIAYYAAMGIDHLRVDFLSWYENGFDQFLGIIGPNRPRDDYATALRWMREAADQHGMQLSVAMSHLFNEAELERQYATSIRVNEDVDRGEWFNFSDRRRGVRVPYWSQWANAFDGLTYWSSISARERVRLDGDFIRLNTYETDTERRTVVSTHLVAGGPIAVADRYDTIGDDVDIYQNREMLALNRDGFVGQPLSNDPTSEASQVWTGRMSDGDLIVALFNRESTPRTRSISFADVGVTGDVTVRDLWQHAPLGVNDSVTVELAPHDSLVMRVSPGRSTCTPQTIELQRIADVVYGNPGPTLAARATSGLPVRFEVALGPARVDSERAQPTGESGIAYVVAKQSGNETWCAAVPAVGSFAVLGGHQPAMYIGADFTNWVPSIEMRREGDTWIAPEVLIPAGDHEFKFSSADDWSKLDWGNAQGLSGTVSPTTGGGPNVRISVPETAFYRFEFNDLTLQYSLRRVRPFT